MTDSRPDIGRKQPRKGIAQLYGFARVPGAGLPGAGYRDFSASRHQVRAQFRYRVQWEQTNAKAKEQAAAAQIEAPAQPPPTGGDLSGHAQNEAVVAGAGDAQDGHAPTLESMPPLPAASPGASAPNLSTHEEGSGQKSGEESGPEKEKQEKKLPGLPELDSEPLPQWFQLAPGRALRAAHQARAQAKTQAATDDAGAQAQAGEGEAARWYVLNSIFPQESRSPAPSAERQTGSASERAASALAVFSFAGGVGKTSLVATLGRALAAYGERVLLAETTPFGLLPLYFGSREQKPGVVRVFSPPQGSPDLPLEVVSLEAVSEPGLTADQAGGQDPFLEELLRHGRGSNRILIDVQTASKAALRRLFPLVPTALVPLLPDMNSIVSLEVVRAAFAAAEDSGTRRIEPVYLLNQFDPSLPLHLDVREMLRRRLGGSLLPFVVRRSPAISEALAEGMTVVDYRPDSSAAEDYFHLAGWLRSTTAAAAGFCGVRWSERPPLAAEGSAGAPRS